MISKPFQCIIFESPRMTQKGVRKLGGQRMSCVRAEAPRTHHTPHSITIPLTSLFPDLKWEPSFCCSQKSF